MIRSANLASSTHEGGGKWARQEVPEHPGGDDHEDKRNEKSSIEANNQGGEEEAVMALPVPSPPPTVI